MVGEWSKMIFISCYISPNCDLAQFDAFLNSIGLHVSRFINNRIIVAGDFNAHSESWGSKRTNAKGISLGEWALNLDLRLINTRSTPTCVRWQGEFVVDITWASPSAFNTIINWEVLSEIVLIGPLLHKYKDTEPKGNG